MARRIATPDGTFCSTCGVSLGDRGPPTCPSCGEAFEVEVQGTRCPQCGRVVDGGEAACPTCGMELAKPEPGSPASALLQEFKALREEGRREAGRLERAPSAMPEESDAALLAELESLWKLSEPFEQVVAARRKRLALMDHLIAAARRRVRELEASDTPAEVRERDELKRQLAEVTLERDEILKIEYGITEMERIYRNIITMQQKELRTKEDALRTRLETFRSEIGERDAERKSLTEREQDLEKREQELKERIAEFEARQPEAKASPGAAPSQGEPAGTPPEAPAITREQWMAAQKEIQNALLELRDTGDETVVPTAANVQDMKARVSELEEAIEKITEEKAKLEGDITQLRAGEEHAREVLEHVDELLGKLPDDEIRRFARSDVYKKYEELLKRLGL